MKIVSTPSSRVACWSEITQIDPPSPNPILVGNDTTFKIRANNDGPDAANPPITVKISYNQDVTIVSASQTAGGGDFSCSPSNGVLSAGSFITCTKNNHNIFLF